MLASQLRSQEANAKAHKPTLVMLHGWGYDNSCWPQRMLQRLRLTYNLILLDLPGHGTDHWLEDDRDSLEQLDEWITATKQQLPQQYHLMGWSLGAQIAIRMAYNDVRVERLVLMAVNAKFVASEDWPEAMLPSLLDQFQQGYQLQAHKTMRRFASLQSQGSTQAKQLASKIMGLMPVQEQKLFGLKLLQELDERTHLSQLSQPCCIELALGDELVPCGWVENLQLPSNVQIHTVAGSHGYLLEQDDIDISMANFLNYGEAK